MDSMYDGREIAAKEAILNRVIDRIMGVADRTVRARENSADPNGEKAAKAGQQILSGAPPVNPADGFGRPYFGGVFESTRAGATTANSGVQIEVKVGGRNAKMGSRTFVIAPGIVAFGALGRYPTVSAKVLTQNVALGSELTYPVYFGWLDQFTLPSGHRWLAPQTSHVAGTTYLVPEGSAEVISDTGVTITWDDYSATVGGGVATATMAVPCVVGQRMDVLGTSFTVSGACKLRFLLWPL